MRKTTAAAVAAFSIFSHQGQAADQCDRVGIPSSIVAGSPELGPMPVFVSRVMTVFDYTKKQVCMEFQGNAGLGISVSPKHFCMPTDAPKAKDVTVKVKFATGATTTYKKFSSAELTGLSLAIKEKCQALTAVPSVPDTPSTLQRPVLNF